MIPLASLVFQAPQGRGDPDLHVGPQARALGLCVVVGALCGLLTAQTLSQERSSIRGTSELHRGSCGVAWIQSHRCLSLTMGLNLPVFKWSYLTDLL